MGWGIGEVRGATGRRFFAKRGREVIGAATIDEPRGS
jgi:hypothetical protein